MQDINEDIPKVEQNRDTDKTSMYSWHNCVSSFTAVQDVDKDIPSEKQGGISNHNISTSPTVPMVYD